MTRLLHARYSTITCPLQVMGQFGDIREHFVTLRDIAWQPCDNLWHFMWHRLWQGCIFYAKMRLCWKKLLKILFFYRYFRQNSKQFGCFYARTFYEKPLVMRISNVWLYSNIACLFDMLVNLFKCIDYLFLTVWWLVWLLTRFWLVVFVAILFAILFCLFAYGRISI